MKKFLISMFMLCSALVAMAQDGDPHDEETKSPYKVDTEIEEMLIRRNMNYSVMSSSENEFRIETNLGNGRSQGGFIDSRVRKINGDYYRDIMALVLVTTEMPSAETLFHILEVNEKLEQGFFEMFHNGTDYVVRYKNRVHADLKERTLIDAYFYGITVSDQLEKEITDGGDIE